MITRASLQSHPKPLGNYSILMLSLSIIALIPLAGSAHAQTSSQLTVSSQDTSGNTITGYYTVLYFASGYVDASSFTPASFTVNDGQSYTVQVDDYGSCHFDHWADTGSTSASRTITVASDTQLTAVYDCTPSSSSSVTVNSVSGQNGQSIFGYYTVLSQDGNVVATGFTTKTFATVPGQTYQIQADSYGSCTFSNWDDGVASNPRTFTAAGGSLSFEAVYTCGPPPSASLSIVTQNSQLQEIFGYYVAFSQNGAQLSSCFSPCVFYGNVGQVYQVQVYSYGSETFNHYPDGSTNPLHSFQFIAGVNASANIWRVTYSP